MTHHHYLVKIERVTDLDAAPAVEYVRIDNVTSAHEARAVADRTIEDDVSAEVVAVYGSIIPR